MWTESPRCRSHVALFSIFRFFALSPSSENAVYLTESKLQEANFNICIHGSPGSVVGIETGYGLDGPGIESRWRARFSASVQTGPGAHPASRTMGTGSFLGVKVGRDVTLTPHPLLVPWSRKSRANFYSPYGSYGLYRASVPVHGCTLLLYMEVRHI